MPQDLDDQLDEIGFAAPHERERAPLETRADWPPGWCAVSDGNNGYIAYFANAVDATLFIGALKSAARSVRAFKKLLSRSATTDPVAPRRGRRPPEPQYGVFDTWKKRWCPLKPMNQAAAAVKATAYNAKPTNSCRFESRQLPRTP